MRLSLGENMTQIPKLKDEDFGIFVAMNEVGEWIYLSLDPETFKQARENIGKQPIAFDIYKVDGHSSYEAEEETESD